MNKQLLQFPGCDVIVTDRNFFATSLKPFEQFIGDDFVTTGIGMINLRH